MKKYLLFFLLVMMGNVWGQTSIVKQDFDGTNTLTYTVTGGSTFTGNSASGDRPASTPFYTSEQTAYGITNGTATLTFANTDGLSNYTSKYVQFRLASFSINSTGNGADGTDIVTVAISTDGGTNYSNEIRVLGNSNAFWGYSTGTGIASVIYDGNNIPTDFTPGGGGSRTTDGYSTVKINLSNSTSQVKVKITMVNNAAGERWVIDDVEIKGTIEPATQTSDISFSAVQTTAMTINWTNGDGANRVVFMKEGSGSITDPSDGIGYTASTDWNVKGTQLGTSGYYCVYSGSGSSVTVTNLVANTTYYVYAYEYNGTGTSANYLTTNPANASQSTQAATSPTLTISHDGLTEENLNNATILVTLANAEFADATLDKGNFTLLNAPAGVSISSVEYLTTTTANVVLEYNGIDFDGNVTNFGLQIASSELNPAGDLTSNSLIITATIETTPTVTTNEAVSDITINSATCGGNVSADGGEPVIQKGIVWNTSTAPTIGNFKTEEGAGIGLITGNMTGLKPNTTYYVRAYATNNVGIGTSYGEERTFKTNNLSVPNNLSSNQITTTGFKANWQAVEGAESYRLDVSEYSNFSNTANTTDLFISEYCEGSSNNKYIEIFNGTGNSVDLNNYKLKIASNGSSTFGSPISLGSSSLQNNKVFVIANNQANPSISNKSDLTSTNISFNGDDVVGLFKNDVLIDVFGNLGNPKDNNYSVAGVGGASQDHTIIRKQTVTQGNTNWSSSAGTNTENSEWLVKNVDDFTDLGLHAYGAESYLTDYKDKTINSNSEVLSGLTANTNYYFRVRAYCPTGTSDNSTVYSVKTANNSQNPEVQTGSPIVVVGNNSGIQQITFNNVTNSGNVIVSYFNNSPSNATYNGGTPTHVSEYRWIIEPSSALVFVQGEGYTLRFQVSDCPGINILDEGNNTALFLYKRSNHGNGEFQNCGALTYHQNGTPLIQSDDYLESALITTGFSEFVFGSPNQALPIELTAFTAKYLSSGVVLNWQTATEINNNKFEVERQINDGNWEVVGEVLGHGNSNTVIDYTYTDIKTSTKGKYNYRLKQIDNDGTFKYTQVVNVTVGNLDSYELAQNYPNPFNPSTNINFTMPKAGNVKIVLFNALGQEVATLFNGNKDAGFHTVQFNANGLPSGIYFYQMTSEGFNQVKKMILAK